MANEKVAMSFVQEFVLGFGFLSGLWIHVGVDPETEVIKAFAQIINQLAPSSGFSLIFWLIPIVVFIVSIAGSFLIGQLLGLIAVGLAFLGGVFISSIIGIVLLIAGIILGFIAPLTRE